MQAAETLDEFARRYGRGRPDSGQVAIYRIEDVAPPAAFPHIRRDFYKIKLLRTTQGVLSYADKKVAVAADTLLFANPLIPYSWEQLAGHATGYACLFTEEFITQQLRPASVASSPLFRASGTPVLFPTPEVVARLSTIFEQMLVEMQSAYVHKYDLLRNYTQLILHEALKLAPVAPAHQAGTSAARLTTLFLDLLDRQFPLASPQHTLQLKNANEFARQLAVHTNHLNKALRSVTGKTTTEHLAEKLLSEAKSLLRYSNWSLAEISYCLGFEHASNFNSFFKKRTGQPPNYYRRQPAALS